MKADIPRNISLIGQLAVMAAASSETEMTPSSHVFPDRVLGGKCILLKDTTRRPERGSKMYATDDLLDYISF